MGVIKKIRSEYAKSFKPLHIHAEAVYEDNVWENVKWFVESGLAARRRAVWYVITPVNYLYNVSTLGCRLTKRQLERKLKERYGWLIGRGQELQLHVHCIYNPQFFGREPLENETRKDITDALKWLKSIGAEPTEFAFGWFSSTDAMRGFVESLGLRVESELENGFMVHDYELGLLYGDKSRGKG